MNTRVMVLFIILVFSGPPPPRPTPQPPVGPFRGYAAHYNVHRMEKTSQIRGMPLVKCMVATDLVPLGWEVDVMSLLTGEIKRCRGTDVSKDVDLPRHLANRLYIEFDWPSGAHMCQLRYVGQKRWKGCPVLVWIVRYPMSGWEPPVTIDRDVQPQLPPNWEQLPRVTRRNDPACRNRHEAQFEPQCRWRERVEQRRH